MVRHALVIEDDSAIRDYVAKVLTEMGYEVTQAATAADGWTRWRQQDFAVVVTDNNLPRESGEFPKPFAHAFASLMRADAAVVVYSGDDLRDACEQLGVVYVSKGSGFGALREGVERAVGVRR